MIKSIIRIGRDTGGGNREEIIEIYREQRFLQDGADDCGADYDTERHYEFCQPAG